SQVLSDGARCVAPLFYMEPDSNELVRLLRWAYENPKIGRALGRAASTRARGEWTWSHVGKRIVERLKVLAERPIRRFCSPPSASAPMSNAQETSPAARSSIEEDASRLTALELSLLRGELESQ